MTLNMPIDTGNLPYEKGQRICVGLFYYLRITDLTSAHTTKSRHKKTGYISRFFCARKKLMHVF